MNEWWRLRSKKKENILIFAFIIANVVALSTRLRFSNNVAQPNRTELNQRTNDKLQNQTTCEFNERYVMSVSIYLSISLSRRIASFRLWPAIRHNWARMVGQEFCLSISSRAELMSWRFKKPFDWDLGASRLCWWYVLFKRPSTTTKKWRHTLKKALSFSFIFCLSVCLSIFSNSHANPDRIDAPFWFVKSSISKWMER